MSSRATRRLYAERSYEPLLSRSDARSTRILVSAGGNGWLAPRSKYIERGAAAVRLPAIISPEVLDMSRSSCGPWDQIRRDLADRAYGILLVDLIPIGTGALASRYLGGDMWGLGLAVAAWVTVCFAVVLLGDLALQCALGWSSARRGPDIGRLTAGPRQAA